MILGGMNIRRASQEKEVVWAERRKSLIEIVVDKI